MLTKYELRKYGYFVNIYPCYKEFSMLAKTIAILKLVNIFPVKLVGPHSTIYGKFLSGKAFMVIVENDYIHGKIFVVA